MHWDNCVLSVLALYYFWRMDTKESVADFVLQLWSFGNIVLSTNCFRWRDYTISEDLSVLRDMQQGYQIPLKEESVVDQ